VTTPAEHVARLRSASNSPGRPLDPREAPRPDIPESPPEQVTAAAVPLQEIDPARRDLSASLPPKTALLKVVMARYGNEDAFQLEGYFEQHVWVSDPKELRDQLRPQMVLSQVLSGAASPDTAVKCYRYLLNWSTGKNGLKKWIAMLRDKMGPGARLIIWDDTDFGIPWELFRLDSTGGPDTEWLGVAVQAIRWTTVHDPARSDQFSGVATRSSEGGIVLYEDPSLVKDQRHSLAALNYPGTVSKNDMKALLAELADASKRYGLVYVRAHGINGDSLDRATLAGVRLGDFEGYALPALRESSAVVFLNACNSATAVFDVNYGDGLNRNFAEVFLRQHASAVIATLAEVPIEPTWRLCRTIVEKARNQGVSVPEFLRARRATYFGQVMKLVHKTGAPVTTEDLTHMQKVAIQGFVYISMFTYFGHPDTVLRLGAP
jgi:hypothetical protein